MMRAMFRRKANSQLNEYWMPSAANRGTRLLELVDAWLTLKVNSFCGWPGSPLSPLSPLAPLAPLVPLVPLAPLLPLDPELLQRMRDSDFLHFALAPTTRRAPVFLFLQALSVAASARPVSDRQSASTSISAAAARPVRRWTS